MILIIALMIWRLMERQMRLYLKQEGITLPGWDNKPTRRPTSFMMTTVCNDILAAFLHGDRVILRGIGQRQEVFLQALGIYTDPGSLCVPTMRTNAC